LPDIIPLPARSIQKPYENGDEDSYREDIMQRYLNGEFIEQDSIQFADSLKFETPGGKIVYGGGGIMPDIFVPVDTTAGSDFLYDVRRKGYMYSFAYEYTDKNRGELSKFNDYKKLRKFIQRDGIFQKFVSFAAKKGVKPQGDDLIKSKETIQVQIEGLVIRNIIGDDGFYPIIHEIDNTLEKALESFN
jgi:carboxyl-terminal processing protease